MSASQTGKPPDGHPVGHPVGLAMSRVSSLSAPFLNLQPGGLQQWPILIEIGQVFMVFKTSGSQDLCDKSSWRLTWSDMYTPNIIYIYISIYLSLSLSKYCKVDERGKSICRTRFKIFDDFWLSSQWMPVNLDSIRGSCLATALTIQYSLRIVGSDPPLSTATPALLCRPMRQTCDMNVQYF